MKYLWEAQDVVPGRRVDAHNRSEQYVIAYDPAVDTAAGNLRLVSLRDGMISGELATAGDLAARMNSAGIRPVSIDLEDHKDQKNG